MGALGEPASGVFAAEPATSWNFDAMGAQSIVKDDVAADPEQDLVENIARAMQNRPLMRRLANVEAAYSGAPVAELLTPAAPPAEETPSPPAEAAETPPLETASPVESELAKIKRLVEEAEEGWVMPPSSADWLGKAQRERSRARLRNAAAWIATFAIGGSIIATTALMLQP
jgi:hypothetical protein